MLACFKKFYFDDSGATTVDWVVLTGGCVALAIIMLTTMNGSISSVATEMHDILDGVEVTEVANVGYAN